MWAIRVWDMYGSNWLTVERFRKPSIARKQAHKLYARESCFNDVRVERVR